MAGLLDLFNPDALNPGGLYGDLLSPGQRQALAGRGLLAAAAALGQAAMPSRMPVPLGAALGSAAGAMGQAEDTGALNAMRGGLLGLQGQQLRSMIDIRNRLLDELGPAGSPGGLLSPSAPAGAPSAASGSPTPGPSDALPPPSPPSGSPAAAPGLLTGGAVPFPTRGAPGVPAASAALPMTMNPNGGPPQFAATVANGAMTPVSGASTGAAPAPSLVPGGAPDINRIVRLGMLGDMAGFPSLGQLLTGTPGYQGAVASAKAQANIKPFIGGERRGSPIFRFNPATNNYDLVVQNPQLPEGAIEGPNGTISMAPGAPQAISSVEAAKGQGAGQYQPETYYDQYGNQHVGTRAQLPGVVAAGGIPSATSGGGARLMAGGAMPSAGPNAPVATAAAATAPRPEAAGPIFPVQTPGGTKDIGSVTMQDMFPGGQGLPARPGVAGMGFGPPNAAQSEMQKDDAEMVGGWQKEAQGNQKIYQDLAHLRDILQTGLQTGTLAPVKADIANLAGSLGVSLPGSFGNATDPAVFNKAATDLVFAAVKKLAGQVRVAEITGYQRANPSLSMPPQANMSIVNDVLANGKWEDARARLGGEYVTQFPGAPLSSFTSKYNEMAPLANVTANYQKQIIAAGGSVPGLPGFEQPGGAKSAQPTAPSTVPPGSRYSGYAPSTGLTYWIGPDGKNYSAKP